MKVAGMLVVVGLLLGTGQVLSGQGRSGPNQEQVRRDQIRIAVQKICPISGGQLGEHGAPIKVKVGQETVFLCCQGCLKEKIDAKHWATIHANFAKAQRICPVMKKKISTKSKWTVVDGQIVYICCPPCSKKIAADPGTFLRKVDDLYTASLQATRVRR